MTRGPNRRTQGEQLEKEPQRRRILSIIRKAQAIRDKDIVRRIGDRRGSAQYHLRLLKDRGLIDSETVARRTFWFAPNTPPPVRAAALFFAPERRREIARLVLACPGIAQKDVTRRLRISRKVLRSHLDQLVAGGWIMEHALGRPHRYYPTAFLRLRRRWIAP